MFNMVIAFEKCNLNPLIDSFDTQDHNLFVTEKTSEKIISGIFREIYLQNQKQPAQLKFCATRFSEVRMFRINEILYIESFGNLKCITGSSETFEFYGKMEQIAKALGGLGFVRIHKSYIVSLDHICKAGSRHVQMDNGKILNVGRKYIQTYRVSVKNISAPDPGRT